MSTEPNVDPSGGAFSDGFGQTDAQRKELQEMVDLLEGVAREEESVLKSAQAVSVPDLEDAAEERFLRMARERAPRAASPRGVDGHLRRPGRRSWRVVTGRWNRWILTLAALVLALFSIRALRTSPSPPPGAGQLGESDVTITRGGWTEDGSFVVEWTSTLQEVVFTVRIQDAETGEEVYGSPGIAGRKLELPSSALRLANWPAQVSLEVEAVTASGQSVGFDEARASLD